MTIVTAIVDVSEQTGGPDTASIDINTVGTIGGIRLKEGQLVRPWIT